MICVGNASTLSFTGFESHMGNSLGLLAGVSVRPRVKVWLEANGEHVFCSGMCQILEAIEQTGSIKEAAESVGLSYRHVWARIKEVEAALGIPVVHSQVGGRGTRRTTLTASGQILVHTYTRLKQRMIAVSDECAIEMLAELRRAKP